MTIELTAELDDAAIRAMYDEGPSAQAVADRVGSNLHRVRESLVRTGGLRPGSAARIDHAKGRTCRRCGEWKTPESFYHYLGHRLSPNCKECYAEVARAYPRELKRAQALRRNYGLTVKEYDELLERQGAVCALCKGEEYARRNGEIRPLAVDHDHETGEVRGLLCNNCNLKVGGYESAVRFGVDRIKTYLGSP